MKFPAPLTPDHRIDRFDCGNPTLTTWLQQRAVTNQASGATRTFVVTDDQQRVLAYYALAVGSIARDQVPGRISRAMPDPIPMVILARLAVDRSCQRLGLGRQLIADAVLRTRQIATQAGVRALLVSAIDEAAATFYRRLGFVPTKSDDHVLVLRLAAVEAVLSDSIRAVGGADHP